MYQILGFSLQKEIQFHTNQMTKFVVSEWMLLQMTSENFLSISLEMQPI